MIARAKAGGHNDPPPLQWRQMRNLGNYALEYEKLGWFVLPVDPKNKKPLVEWACRKDNRPTRDEIKSWFGRWQSARIGIVTGAASEFDVIDLDTPSAIARIEALCGGKLTATS